VNQRGVRRHPKDHPSRLGAAEVKWPKTRSLKLVVGATSMNALFKLLAVMPALLFAIATGSDAQPLPDDEATDHAFEIERTADYVVEYTIAGKYDIGVGHIKDDARHPQVFTAEELEHYFTALKHKDLIVIVIQKNTWTSEDVERRVAEINSYFFKCGFNRVVVQQGRAFSRGTWSDRTRQ
jgi:hypothetical protein